MTPLQKAMEEKNITPTELAMRTDSHINSIRVWLRGEGLPNQEKRAVLDKLFPGICDEMVAWRKRFTVLN